MPQKRFAYQYLEWSIKLEFGVVKSIKCIDQKN